MFSESDAHAILARALDAANAEEADASFVATDQNISRFANSNLHQNMSEETASLTLRVIVNGSQGVATTTVFDADELARTAALAHEAARHSDRLQNFGGLYRETAAIPGLRTYDEETAGISAATKAQTLREMFDRGRAAGVEFAGSYLTSHSAVACANTHGVRRFTKMSFADSSVIALRPGGSGYATSCDRHVGRLDILKLGEEATLKATLRNESIEELDPGAFDVVLEPPAIAEVFEWLNLIAFTGQSYEDGSSLMHGRIGERVFGENVTVSDDSVDDEFLPFPFDLEGMPKRRLPLIEHGIARTPCLDKAYADRLGFAPTGNAWGLGSSEHGASMHVAIDGGTATREELIRSTKLGIWVTRFNYVNGLLEPRSALMTGTTRDGTFLIRDGEIAARLPNLRWTQSMVDAFSNVEGLTAERRRVSTWFNPFGGTIAPVMKIRGWNFTGKQGK